MPPANPNGLPLDPALEAEIEAALQNVSMAEIDTPEPTTHSTRGARPERQGTVVQIRGEEVLVEFGPRTSGVCPLSAFESPPPLGSKHPFTIDRRDADDVQDGHDGADSAGRCSEALRGSPAAVPGASHSTEFAAAPGAMQGRTLTVKGIQPQLGAMTKT